MKTCIMGANIQGLIAGALLARGGIKVTIVDFPNGDYTEFGENYKTGPVTHIPFPLPDYIITDLSLELDFEKSQIDNPFEKLPFYNGLKTLLEMFESLEQSRPDYKEKAWRDAWGTFELGRILSEYDSDIQELFARHATLSLVELLNATDLNDEDKGKIIAVCTLGAKTDAQSSGSAASILPALALYETKNCRFFVGSLHDLRKSLIQACMAYGANIIDEQAIEQIVMEGKNIRSVGLSGGEVVTADHYILDHDPVWLFRDYLKDHSISPSFKNRIFPKQNLKECVHLKMGVSKCPTDLKSKHSIPASSPETIIAARNEMKADGGAQHPLLSIVNCTLDNDHLSTDGTHVFDVIAQYFDPTIDGDNTAIIDAVKQSLNSLYDGFSDHIEFIKIDPMATQFGQPSFVSSMPLLQLFKIFFGHHSLGYDMPIDNMVVCGYGTQAVSHYHIRDAGIRVATLLQSL